MEKLEIQGGSRLSGKISVSGMKNSALPIIFACLTIPHECVLENIPRVSDVYNALEILKSMGALAEFCSNNTVIINTKDAQPYVGRQDLVCKMRASSYLMGAMLARFSRASVAYPGGCNFGARPLDLHFKGFGDLGAEIEENDGLIDIKLIKKPKTNKIILDKISVGATINMVLATASLCEEVTIENCATEPHVDDLICFLNRCGMRIKRCGKSIYVKAPLKNQGTTYKIFPDMIEALTYATCVGICKGRVLLENVVCEHLAYVTSLYKQMGFCITEMGNSLLVEAEAVRGGNAVTAPYPLFPTDLHPQFASLLCFSQEGGSVRDDVFPTRFAYVNELKKMSARIKRRDNVAIVSPSRLKGAEIDATDLRAGASLVIAALGAEGTSIINNVNYIVRGYECLVDKIANIGGKIKIYKEN